MEKTNVSTVDMHPLWVEEQILLPNLPGLRWGQTMIITLKLPWPPSTNQYYRVVNNRAILSKAAREYRARVEAEHYTNNVVMTGRLSVVIYATPPDKRLRDLDNMLKQPLDALQHAGAGWYKDDSQIDQLMIRRMNPNKKDPHLLVTIDDGDTGNNTES